MSGALSSGFLGWPPSPSASTPDNASSATLIPTSSESDHDDPRDKTFDSFHTPSGGDMSSACAELSIADDCPLEMEPVADKKPGDEDVTSRPPLLRSLSFTVEKPSLALLLWGSKTPKEADDDVQKPDSTDKSFSPTATPQKTESNDSLSGTSPASTDLSSSQPSLVSSKTDGEDSMADGIVDNGADDMFADTDTSFEACNSSACSDSKGPNDDLQLSGVKAIGETFSISNGAEDKLPTPFARPGVTPLKRGDTFVLSSRQIDGHASESAAGDRRYFPSTGSVECSAAELSAVSSSQPISSNDAEQAADDADQDSDGETSSVSSDDSFRSTKGLDFMEEMLAEHNKAMDTLSRNLALEFVKDGSASLATFSPNGNEQTSWETPETTPPGSRTASFSDEVRSDVEQRNSERCEDSPKSRLQCADVSPSATGSTNRDLLAETKETLDPRWRRGFARLTALIRGHLTRRLMKTDRVQTIIQTIKDTLECALALHQEPHIRCGTITSQDLELHQRLITQLTAACHELHDVFFRIPCGDRMRLIEQLRSKKTSDATNNLPKRISAATQKALRRRLSRDDVRPRAGGCREAVLAVQRAPLHPATETRLAPSGATRKICRLPMSKV
ncbi:uncharacterized protein LOC8025867 [Ixodes scapularis]|uniref:uncharacterized protein LOC8025867 n=1 Tax=Ixodes scapularis TaxID=6945 RepID=UPI001C38E11D|nr:uncharacterized protein LOC8025867 [Ixodes scapularis]